MRNWRMPAKEFEKKYISNNSNENTATVFPSEEQKNGENKETEKVQANFVGENEEKEKKEEIVENPNPNEEKAENEIKESVPEQKKEEGKTE